MFCNIESFVVVYKEEYYEKGIKKYGKHFITLKYVNKHNINLTPRNLWKVDSELNKLKTQCIYVWLSFQCNMIVMYLCLIEFPM